MDVRRFLFRLNEIFDYRTFVVAGAFATLLLVAYSYVAAIQQAHDTVQSADQRGKAASRRIDMLQTRDAERQREIAVLNRQMADLRQDKGELADAVRALSTQVRQSGREPVTQPSSANSPRPSAAPSPSPTHSASPKPTHSASPKPSPSSSPSCRRLPIIGCPGAGR